MVLLCCLYVCVSSVYISYILGDAMTVHILLNGFFNYQDICVEKAHYSISRHQLELYEGHIMHLIKLDQIIDIEFRNGDIGLPLLLVAKGWDVYVKETDSK